MLASHHAKGGRQTLLDLQKLFHLGDHLRRLNGLGDVRIRSKLERALAIFLRAFGGDDDDGRGGMRGIGSHALDEFESVP